MLDDDVEIIEGKPKYMRLVDSHPVVRVGAVGRVVVEKDRDFVTLRFPAREYTGVLTTPLVNVSCHRCDVEPVRGMDDEQWLESYEYDLEPIKHVQRLDRRR